MSTIKVSPAVTPGDRLGMMLFFGTLLHGLVILGISFTASKPSQDKLTPMLDIIIVQTKSTKKPEDVDFLAQASQEGGGTMKEKVRPAKPVKGIALKETQSLSKTPLAPPPSVKSEPVKQKKPVTSKTGKNIVLSKPDKPKDAKKKRLTAQRLISMSKEIASLTAEIDVRRENYAKRPKRQFKNASTREYRFASYIKSWTQKVEKIGNLNYPDEARRRRLSGRLVLDVAIMKDGSVENIILRKSSGHAALDDAAIRIVKLGAPYAPLPENIRKDTDILHITRTWEFLSSNRLRGGD